MSDPGTQAWASDLLRTVGALVQAGREDSADRLTGMADVLVSDHAHARDVIIFLSAHAASASERDVRDWLPDVLGEL